MFYYVSKFAWLIATPSNLLVLMQAAGLVLMAARRTRRLGIGLAVTAASLLLLVGFAPVGNWLILPLEDRFPAFAGERREIAGIIVLGGSVLAKDSLARRQLVLNGAGERVTALIELTRRYPDARIVLSAGGSTLLTEEPAEADVLATYVESLGISRSRVLVEARSRTTWENAILTRALVTPGPGERWLLLTSAWHMPRAVGCFRAAGFEVVPYPVDYRTRGSMDRSRGFFFASDGLRRTDLAAKEWIGLLFYRLSRRSDALFPGPEAVPAAPDQAVRSDAG